MDRNLRVTIIVQAESVERRTKAKGKQAGVLGQSGLRVLRSLLFDFAHLGTGRCMPSYQTIRRATGLATSTIGKALRRLEAAGFLETTRRMVRVGRRWLRTSNSYGFKLVTIFVQKPLQKNKEKMATPMPRLSTGMPESLKNVLASWGARMGFAMPE
jgi:DNA-binding MarR family transcriptional regulator